MKNQKRILFINQDSGYLTIDIINSFVDEGYTCSLITGRLVQRNIPLYDSVKVKRIRKYNRSSAFKRLITWSLAFIQILFLVIFRHRKDILFIISNPPFATFLPLLVKNPFYLLIFDIYPDALTELGYMPENSKIIKWWQKANIRVFRKTNCIFTISEGMKTVLQKYTVPEQIIAVNLWTDNTFFKPVHPDDNPFIKKHHLGGKFVVMYSGNLGLAGDIEVLLDVAARIRNDKIIFVIIGEGAKRKMLVEKVKDLHLENVIILPWQPAAEIPNSFAAASLSVISLGSKASKLAVPSKLFNFLSAGTPLLCISLHGSEIETLVNYYQCGKNFDPEDIEGMENFILQMNDNKKLQAQMRINSAKASEDFTISNVKKFVEVLNHES